MDTVCVCVSKRVFVSTEALGVLSLTSIKRLAEIQLRATPHLDMSSNITTWRNTSSKKQNTCDKDDKVHERQTN